MIFIVTLIYSDKITGFLQPSAESLVQFGANQNNKQIWRLFTYMFLHGSFFHILCNSLAQIYFCLGTEKRWGIIKFAILYFGGGIIGGLFSQSNCSVGASCAILSTMGCFISIILMYYSRCHPTIKRQMLTWVVSFVVMFIIICFLPQIDYLGHLGGFVGGFGIGLILFKNHFISQWKKWGVLAGCVIVLLSILIPDILLFTK